MELIFATGNAGKLQELQDICDVMGREFGVEVKVLAMPQKYDIPETGMTYEENAFQKAEFVWKKWGVPCIADDSGMEVEALDGGPGIYTARYCDRNFSSGIDKLLHELKQLGAMTPEQRKASFECCLCVIGLEGGRPLFFHGHCPGTISPEACGNSGFGFDPVFIPDSTPGLCMAELPERQKNTLSHRALAARELFRYLNGME